LEKRFDGNIIAKKAGLGIILQRPEHAVVLHNGARVTRVVGGDIVFTKRLERVLELVDLRNHILIVPEVKAITKDGMGVKLTLFVPCRIDRIETPSSSERLYPFNPNNVFKAVCEENIAEDGKQSWYKLTMQKARRATCDVISTYILDRLLVAEEPDQKPRGEIRERIKSHLTAEMVGSGIEIIGVGFANIEPDDSLDGQSRGTGEEEGLVNVATQRVNSWQVKWQRRANARRAEGEAEAIRILEQARAKALIELINAVEEGFREMASHDNGAQPGDIIALSFVSAIEQMLSQQNFPKPLEIFNTQSTLQEIRRLMLSPVYEQKKG
jgi:regulator of protease activity HflC (stomatin/prohibitin superfamily)